MSEFFSDNLLLILGLIGLALALTFAVFHWRSFDEGYEKGDAADPERVARENPPDEWSKSHWTS